MCPADDSHLTLEFHDHYVITPTIRFYGHDINFKVNNLNETGVPVEQGYEYNSGNNSDFLTIDEIKKLY